MVVARQAIENFTCDAHDGHALRMALGDFVLPTYYDNRDKWIDMMKESITTAYEDFSARLMVDTYYEKLYR